MIELLIPCIEKFSRETFLGRLESIEESLRQSRELTRVEITFSALSIWPSFSRSVSTHGDFSSNSRTRFDEDKKIEEGITLLVRRELDGNNIFKCWICNESGHYASKCPKREKKYKGNFNSRRPKNYLYVDEDEESDEKV